MAFYYLGFMSCTDNRPNTSEPYVKPVIMSLQMLDVILGAEAGVSVLLMIATFPVTVRPIQRTGLSSSCRRSVHHHHKRLRIHESQCYKPVRN